MSPREPLPDPLFTDVVLPPLFKGVDDAGANLVKELAHAMVSAFNAIAGQAATAMDIVQASVKGVGGAIQEGVKIILGAEAAANIDLSGDLFAFIGSLQDVIIDERLLTSGPLDFSTVLRYENRLAGLRMVIVMVSFAFSLIVEVATFGQVEGFVGLLIHLIDDVVADQHRIVATSMIRRAVAVPLEAGYDRIHRHKELSTSEAEESFALGLLPDDEYVDVLVSNSFTDRAIQRKVELARVRALNQAGVFPLRTKAIPPSTLAAAYAAKIVTDEEFLGELARQGYDDNALEIYHALAQLKKPPPLPPEG